jgi:hypothetical protein
MGPPAPTRRQVARDQHLRRLAATPSLALQRWSRLTEAERTIVVVYMMAQYGFSFAQQFRIFAAQPGASERLIEITNDARITPDWLASHAYRPQRSDGGLSIWVHPSGHSVWTLPRPQSLVPSDAGQRPSESSIVSEARHSVDELNAVNSHVVSQQEINGWVNTPVENASDRASSEYRQMYDEFREDLGRWDNSYAETMSRLSAWRAYVRPEARHFLEVEIGRAAGMQAWRRGMESFVQQNLTPH